VVPGLKSRNTGLRTARRGALRQAQDRLRPRSIRRRRTFGRTATDGGARRPRPTVAGASSCRTGPWRVGARRPGDGAPTERQRRDPLAGQASSLRFSRMTKRAGGLRQYSYRSDESGNISGRPVYVLLLLVRPVRFSLGILSHPLRPPRPGVPASAQNTTGWSPQESCQLSFWTGSGRLCAGTQQGRSRWPADLRNVGRQRDGHAGMDHTAGTGSDQHIWLRRI